MAGNDPGWGGRRGDGPPDLDEMMRNFSRKLNGLFGGNRQGRPDPERGGVPGIPLLPVIGLVAVLWLASGFYIVDQGSRGVVLRFGQHVETTQPGPRWHFPFPIESATVVNLEQVRTVEVGYRTAPEGGQARSRVLRESLMLTDDENIIDLQFAVQYNLKSVEDYLFNNRAVEEQVRGVAESAIREIVGKSGMDFVLYEGREEIAATARRLMQEILDHYQTGISVVAVTMQNAQPPEQVQAAFDDAVKAGQDLERQKNEGQAYANDVIPRARGMAARLLEEAEAHRQRVVDEAKGNTSRFSQVLAEYERAPQVTRERLYLDMQEQVLSSVSKVVVDQKGGNSLLYLPLDKLLDARATAVPPPMAAAPATEQAGTTPERTRDAFRSREREARP